MKKRSINLDLIRTFAIFSVISVHFFYNSGFYTEEIYGRQMMISITVRNFFMVCVPLFLLLTGYLMSNKQPNKKYFLNLSKVLTVYLIASIFCIMYKIIILNQHMTFSHIIGIILNYSGSDYAWYINMYIGLYLLIPYLNIIYKSLKNRKDKTILLLILIFSTIAPSILNIKYQFIPNWWTGIYPITYYFIGSYIKEYNIKIKSFNCILMILSVSLLLGSISYYKSYGKIFEWGSYCNYNSLFVFVISVLIFVFLLNLKNIKVNLFTKIISRISKVSLGMYLLSYIFDNFFYKILNSHITMQSRFVYMPIIVLTVFVSSFILSNVVEFIKNIIYKVLKRRENYD